MQSISMKHHGLTTSEDDSIEPLLGLYTFDWPNWVSVQHLKKYPSRERLRYEGRFDQNSESILWPVGIDYLENIQQRAYWNSQIRHFRASAIKSPRRMGTAWVSGKNPAHRYGPDLSAWLTKTYNVVLDNTVPQNPADFFNWLTAQVQRVKSDAVHNSLAAQSIAISGPQPTPAQEGSSRKFEMDLLDQYLGELTEETQWMLHDQLKDLSNSRFVAIRCHCNLLLSTLGSAGPEEYKLSLRERGKQYFGMLADPRNTAHREPRLWDRTIALLQQIAQQEGRGSATREKRKRDESGHEIKENTSKRAKPDC